MDTSTIDEFASAFPCLSPHTVNGVKAELPSYKAAVDDVDPSTDAHDRHGGTVASLEHSLQACFACPT